MSLMKSPGKIKFALAAWKLKKALDKMELIKMNAEREVLGLDPIRPWFVKLIVVLHFLSS